MQPIHALLAGGDRRSLGRAGEVVEILRRNPKRVGEAVACLTDEDACIAMRAADALEKISREQPALLGPYKTHLLSLLAEATQPEVRWHLAVVVPRLRPKRAECRKILEILESYFEDRSAIVKVMAMQGLADLIEQDETLRPRVMELLQVLTRSGTAAMQARGRKLLGKLEKSKG